MYRLMFAGIAILLLLGGCSSETPTRHNDFVPLTSIEITAAPRIAANTTARLQATGSFSGLFTRDVTDQVVWSSASPAVADFLTSGVPNRVTGRAPGTAVLTATVGGVSNTFSLTVTSATITEPLVIAPAAPSVPEGLTSQFTVTGTFSDASTQDLTFDAVWSSSDPAVATISNAPGSNGLANAIAPGTSTITATFGGVSATTLLTVKEVALRSITVIPANPAILSASAVDFHATGNYSDGTTADITSRVQWESTETPVATISAGGTARTVAPGVATIRASLDGVTGTSSLTVTGGALTGITLSPSNLRLVKGTFGTITATGSFSNGSSRDITDAVDWSVLTPTIATVTTPGGKVAFINANAVSVAPTTVKATLGSINASTSLTVTGPSVRSVAISPSSLTLIAGTSGQFTATASFTDGSTQDVTLVANWTSNASATASVDDTGLAKGRVHGVAANSGMVTISAAFGGFNDTSPVTVVARTVTNLSVSNFPAITVTPGNQVAFTATAGFSDGSTRDVTEDVTWSIDKDNIAMFADSQNQPGQVVGVGHGSAILTARFGGQTKNVTITVP